MTVLLEPRTEQRGYFDPIGVRRILEEHFRGRRDRSSAIWRLLMFELWHRNFLESLPGMQTCESLTVSRGEPA
jgi:hypothetical protein